MLLSHDEISDLLEMGVVEYSDEDNINASSLDLRLGTEVLIERPMSNEGEILKQNQMLNRVVLRERTPLTLKSYNLKKDGPLILYPGEFILAHTHEVFNLPNDISAEYMLKSSMARIGLEHLKAGWCDAGWNGSVLTLELKNVTRCHEIVLHHLDKIGQIKFFRHRPVKAEHSYAAKGRYNGDKSVSGAKATEEDRKVLIIEDENENS